MSCFDDRHRKEITDTFKHILVPYNGTTCSEKIFGKAAALASSIGSKIAILTCLEELPIFGFFKTKTSKQEFEKERKMIL
ncbi:MAG: universal stress protein [Nitrosopumilus sp.]|uniref:universal stress protein n=1 Tax=Nitrosopumilus sp. TaxID=2024843 RepID=UPI0029301A54|nr:universal stress protein [Nitrosopumilus sp.]